CSFTVKILNWLAALLQVNISYSNLQDMIDVCCFASNMRVSDAFSVGLVGAITVIEIAHRRDLNYLWLERDSKLETLAFKSRLAIP
ncbi:hypothetical protein A2U01_0030485, partial [Trifolium medium]|nr:hypothetical protein [Trifolium medium]